MNYKKIVRDTLKKYGDEAAAHFGVNPRTLKRYIKTGYYPPDLMGKILGEHMNAGNPELIASEMMSSGAGDQPATFETFSTGAGAPSAGGIGAHAAPEAPLPPPQSLIGRETMDRFRIPEPENAAMAKRLMEVEKRQLEIEHYLKATVDYYLRNLLERMGASEYRIELLHVEHLRIAGQPSLTRPDQNAPVEQVFTTNPNAGSTVWDRRPNSLDSGVAPTKEQVDAQARMMYIGGVPIPNAQVAGPAVPIPNTPAFGFGWNTPRPRK